MVGRFFLRSIILCKHHLCSFLVERILLHNSCNYDSSIPCDVALVVDEVMVVEEQVVVDH